VEVNIEVFYRGAWIRKKSKNGADGNRKCHNEAEGLGNTRAAMLRISEYALQFDCELLKGKMASFVRSVLEDRRSASDLSVEN